METITATHFRSDLYTTLKKVLMGFEVRIKTKEGCIILIDEKNLNHREESRKIDLLKPKAKGELVDDLDSADKDLRDYIRLPS